MTPPIAPTDTPVLLARAFALAAALLLIVVLAMVISKRYTLAMRPTRRERTSASSVGMPSTTPDVSVRGIIPLPRMALAFSEIEFRSPMRRLLFYGSLGLAIIGLGANWLLFVYTAWPTVSKNPAMIYNPLFHLTVIVSVFWTPLYCLFIGLSAVGLVGMFACVLTRADRPKRVSGTK